METNLSIRERQILRLVAAGMTTKEISATLSIADSTVNWHVGNALAKLGASSRAEAVAIMLRDGPAETPVVIVRTQQRPRVAWPLAAVLALGAMVMIAGGTSLAAWYLGTHQASPNDQPPSFAPARTAPASGNGAPPSASASAGAATTATDAPAPPASTLPPAPITSTVPVLPVTTPALPIATAPAVPSVPVVPSLRPAPSLLPLPPLPTPLPSLPLP